MKRHDLLHLQCNTLIILIPSHPCSKSQQTKANKTDIFLEPPVSATLWVQTNPEFARRGRAKYWTHDLEGGRCVITHFLTIRSLVHWQTNSFLWVGKLVLAHSCIRTYWLKCLFLFIFTWLLITLIPNVRILKINGIIN